jgi:hypothetical protein
MSSGDRCPKCSWKWNRIADLAVGNRRLPPSERARILSQKTVLYLVGPEDHDRRKALSLGFANHNLIAVDLVQERVDEVRRAGGLAIRGSLQQVLMAWPQDWPIDVVDADFCHGIVKDVLVLPYILRTSPGMISDTVVSLNMQRGRDPASNSLRKKMRRYGGAVHRGEAWLSAVVLMEVNSLRNRHPLSPVVGMMKRYRQECSPASSEYRSKTSGQWFDSVIHKWGFSRQVFGDATAEQVRAGISQLLSEGSRFDKAIRGRIAALRAVRTKRMDQWTH